MLLQNRYELPEYNFIGGENQELIFHLFTINHQPMDITGTTCKMVIALYGYSLDYPLITKNGKVVILPDIEKSYIQIDLLPKDTVSLSGKYVYQLSLKDDHGNVEIFQGLLIIINNENKDFI